jgi:hypothetical protein
MNKHDFVFDFEFKLFTFPLFEIDGTSDGEGCDIFIFDTRANKELNIQYSENTIIVNYQERYIESFEFCENFEERVFAIYQALQK